MHGILIIDKPTDWTSHDVVGRLRRLLKTKRIGHTGTLDPFATGVLVMLVGNATRLAQFLDKDVKEYEATLKLGFETDTGDLTGTVSAECGFGNAEIAEVLSQTNWEKLFTEFSGVIEQIPPMYSAKKIDGKKLYELARKGIEIERKAVKITIYDLQITNDENLESLNEFELKVACSAGTYIRTLAEDIGRKLGTLAHLTALRRTRAGKFDLAKSVTLEKLEEIMEKGDIDLYLIPMNEAISHLPERELNENEIIDVKHGRKVSASFDGEDVQIIRMTDAAKNLLAIGYYEESERMIQPRNVFNE